MHLQSKCSLILFSWVLMSSLLHGSIPLRFCENCDFLSYFFSDDVFNKGTETFCCCWMFDRNHRSDGQLHQNHGRRCVSLFSLSSLYICRQMLMFWISWSDNWCCQNALNICLLCCRIEGRHPTDCSATWSSVQLIQWKWNEYCVSKVVSLADPATSKEIFQFALKAISPQVNVSQSLIKVEYWLVFSSRFCLFVC